MELSKWVLENGEKIGVPGLLMFLIVVGAVSLQRKWVVMGWIYKDCVTERDKISAKIEAAAEKADAKVELALSKADAKIAELQAEVESARTRRRT